MPLLFTAMAFGELQRWGKFYFHDFLLIVILLVNFKKLKLFRPVIWFGLAGLASLIFSGFQPGGGYLARFLTYSLLISLAVKPLYLIWFSSLIAGFGLLQYWLVPDTRWLLSLNWDEHYYRLLSTLFDPNFTGIILVLGLVLIYFYRQKSGWLYGLHLAALLLTYSRSSYLALLAVAFYLALIKKKLKLILFIILFLFSLLLLPRPGGEGVKLERLFSIEQRFDSYREGISLWQKSPLFGLGFNTLRYYRQDSVSHAAAGVDSSLIFILATTGVVGLLTYLNLLKALWWKSLPIRVSLVALLVHSLFVNSLFYSFTLIWLFSLVSLRRVVDG